MCQSGDRLNAPHPQSRLISGRLITVENIRIWIQAIGPDDRP